MASFPQQGSASIEIEAKPDAVWTLVADVTRMGELSPECVRVEWTDEAATNCEVGDEFHGHKPDGNHRTGHAVCRHRMRAGARFRVRSAPDSRHATCWRFETDRNRHPLTESLTHR